MTATEPLGGVGLNCDPNISIVLLFTWFKVLQCGEVAVAASCSKAKLLRDSCELLCAAVKWSFVSKVGAFTFAVAQDEVTATCSSVVLLIAMFVIPSLLMSGEQL